MTKRSFILALFFSAIAVAQTPATYNTAEGLYSVPLAESDLAELQAYKDFSLRIEVPYSGSETKVVTYTFPKNLTGDPALQVSLQRDPVNKELWTGDVMNATCTEVGPLFSCQMSWTDKVKQTPVIDVLRVENFLRTQGLPSFEIQQRLKIVQRFVSGEPAGILTYEFTE